jgi:hypothetical protein
VVYLNPVSDPRFYEHSHPADIELPPLWKPTYKEAQPLLCVDESGQLFALEDGCYRLRSAEELRELELESDARNAASAKVHKFYPTFCTWKDTGLCAKTLMCPHFDPVKLGNQPVSW